MLLHQRAKINCVNSNHQTPLLVASAYNHGRIIEFLLKRNAKIENKDKDNFTSLLLASAEGNLEAVKILLEAGADIFAQVSIMSRLSYSSDFQTITTYSLSQDKRHFWAFFQAL